jgi:hypothetical protein
MQLEAISANTRRGTFFIGVLIELLGDEYCKQGKE